MFFQFCPACGERAIVRFDASLPHDWSCHACLGLFIIRDLIQQLDEDEDALLLDLAPDLDLDTPSTTKEVDHV